jgi:hypothetical protein
VFYRVARRRGANKAAVAVAHRILVLAYQIIRDGSEYHEVGGDYFDRLNPERTVARLRRRLEQLGYDVDWRPRQELAPPRSGTGEAPTRTPVSMRLPWDTLHACSDLAASVQHRVALPEMREMGDRLHSRPQSEIARTGFEFRYRMSEINSKVFEGSRREYLAGNATQGTERLLNGLGLHGVWSSPFRR